MSNQAEHIDNFFKENIDKIDVQYNAAHWDKLQKSLLMAATVGTTAAIATSKWQAILKFLKLYKLIFIGIPSAAIVTTSVVYFSKNNREIKPVSPIANDSVYHTTAPTTSNDTQSPQPITKNLFFKPSITTLSDTPRYVSPYSIDTTRKMVSPFKNDTTTTSKKDTTSKKKNLNLFW